LRFSGCELRVFMLLTGEESLTEAGHVGEAERGLRRLLRMLRLDVAHAEVVLADVTHSGPVTWAGHRLTPAELNALFLQRTSPSSELLITNLPPPAAADSTAPRSYAEALQCTADGLPSVLFVAGGSFSSMH